MLTVAEYLAKADELDARAVRLEPGDGREAYSEMARQWRELAVRAVASDTIRRASLSNET